MGARRGLRLGVLLLSLPLSLVAIEGVFRLRAYGMNRETLSTALTVLPEKSPSGRTRFIDIVRSHPNDRIIFELRPNYSGEYYARPFTTDSRGFRSPETPLEAEPGTVTIVGIGGSIMFGHGVGDREDLLSALGAMLNEHRPVRAWRIVNTAVPTYNVVQKVETLKVKGLAFRPDLVVLEIASNNLDLPGFVRVQEEPLDVSRSFILDYFRERVNMKAEAERRNSVLATVHGNQLRWRSSLSPDPAKIPETYRDLVGWAPFRRAFDELKQLSAQHGFAVVVVANLEVDLAGQMLDEARRRGFFVVSAMQDLRDYIAKKYHEEFSLQRYTNSELVVNTENLHPSAYQHRMIAERVMREMSRKGLIDRLVAMVPPAPVAAGTR